MYAPLNGNGLGDTADYNRRRMLVLDDGRSSQNPNPIPYLAADWHAARRQHGRESVPASSTRA